jgi:dihydroorotate dehydrogenase
MSARLSTTFTGLHFVNPFLLASAPPTESPDKIRRAFEAGWGGVVTKTIGIEPAVNVAGPRTKFFRAASGSSHVSMNSMKKSGSVLQASWNWELYSDKTLDWWVPRLKQIKRDFPDRILVASIMAGSGSEEELRRWQELAIACQAAGCDALELNLSCPHMDRADMGAGIGRDGALVSVVTQAVRDVARVPVWAKLTSSTSDTVREAEATFRAGADAVSMSNTFMGLPLIDPNTLEFEMNVDGFVSAGGVGGPAILPLSLAKVSQLAGALPGREFSGIGGIANFEHALNYMVLGCGTVQVCTAAMLDKATGPNIIKGLTHGLEAFLDRHADKGLTKAGDLVGLRRDRVVPHAQIRRVRDGSEPGPGA